MKIHRTLRTAAFLAGMFVCTSAFAQNKGFPQNVPYDGCIMPSIGTAQMNTDIKTLYNTYKSSFLATSTGTSGGYYIKSSGAGPNGGSAITVSEAHGYGMIIMALMAGYDANARTYFDGMIKFWKDHPSVEIPEFMSWEVPVDVAIPATDTSRATSSAADGDLDIAYALILADKQWGSSTGPYNYLSLANTQLGKIRRYIIHSNQYSNPTMRVMFGDFTRWGIDKAKGGTETIEDLKYNTRTSDWMPGHFRTFAATTTTGIYKTDFLAAADTIAALTSYMQSHSSPSTGLLPDFVKGALPVPDATPVTGGEANSDKFSYNACRDPWRMVTDYAHFGTPASKTAVSKMLDWAISSSATGGDPSAFWPGYTLSGTPLNTQYHSVGFTAPIVCAAICDTKYQDFLDAGWTEIKRGSNGQVYETAIALLSMLVISGNWWSPAEAVVPGTFTLGTSPGTGGTISKSPDKASYAPGDVVTLTASPSSGYAFSAWTGGPVVGTGTSVTITMDANKTVGATFVSTGTGPVNMVTSADCGWSVAEWDGGLADTGSAMLKSNVISVAYSTPKQLDANNWPGLQVGAYLPGTLSGLTTITVTYTSSHSVNLEIPIADGYNPYFVLLSASSAPKTVVIPFVQFVENTDNGGLTGVLKIDTISELNFVPVTPVETAAASGTITISSLFIDGVNWPTSAVVPVSAFSRSAHAVSYANGAIKLNIAGAGRYQVGLFSADGRMVRSVERDLSSGMHVVPVAGLAQGVYLVRVRGLGMDESARIIIGR